MDKTKSGISRRGFITTAVTGVASTALTSSASGTEKNSPSSKGCFRFSLNTGTILGYKLPLDQQIELSVKAGYNGIEPWISDISHAAETSGVLKDLRQRCIDSDLSVIGAIGFAGWAVDDDTARTKGLEQMQRDMDLVAQLGGTHIAASPAGVNRPGTTLDLDRVAERYRAVLELGRRHGVTPQLEFWGSSANLNRIDQCLYVAARASHPDACILADAFHMYKGGSNLESLNLLSRKTLHCFHMNDYPAAPPRETIKDADRIWPGDGIAPLQDMLRIFRENHADVWLSVELFNAEYWKRPVEETVRTGLAKMKAVASSEV